MMEIALKRSGVRWNPYMGLVKSLDSSEYSHKEDPEDVGADVDDDIEKESDAIEHQEETGGPKETTGHKRWEDYISERSQSKDLLHSGLGKSWGRINKMVKSIVVRKDTQAGFIKIVDRD